MWYFLLVAAIVILIVHWKGPNAVWGGATLGIIIGLISAIIGEGFNWWTVLKGLEIGTLVGALCEWLPQMVKLTTQDSKD